MSSFGVATIDPKTQGAELEKLNKFLGEMPSAEYTFDTSRPDELKTQICRERGQNCVLLKVTSKQLLSQMQTLDYICMLPQDPEKTDLVCKKVSM